MKAELAFTRAELFPNLRGVAYLNHAAISPPCAPVQTAVATCLQDYATRGAGAFGDWAARRETLRADFARLLGAESEEIALGTNTTRGVTDIALGIPWRRGERVVLFQGEFPANVTPWQIAARQFELELVWLPPPSHHADGGLAALERVLKDGVRLVAVSFVQFQTGFCVPLAAMSRLCHRFGAELFVDAIQGLGAVPLDVRAMGVDYLSSGGHKWLLGVEGAGVLYARKACVKQLRPLTAGWLSHEHALDFLFRGRGHLSYDRPFRQETQVFEEGTGNTLGHAALGASIPLLLGVGIERVYAGIQAYHDALEPALIERGFGSARAAEPSHRSGILSVVPPEGIDLSELAGRLRSNGVTVGTPDGFLRFAPHLANAADEVTHVLTVLDDALAALR